MIADLFIHAIAPYCTVLSKSCKRASITAMKFASVRDLAQLPYFTLDPGGNLHLAEGIARSIIDFHTHIGWRFGKTGPIRHDRTPPVLHFFPETDASIDLNRYSAYDFTPKLKLRCSIETVKPFVTTQGITHTHTAANLCREMARLHIEQSIVLAVDRGNSRNSLDLLGIVRRYPNLIPFVSIDPKSHEIEKTFIKYVKAGAYGIKIHPPMQTVRPNHPGIMKILDLAGQYHLPVLYHCGYSPLMPVFERRFSRMEDFQDAVRSHPDTTIILGHSGIDDHEAVLTMQKKYSNVYAELSGQPPAVVSRFCVKADPDRLLFGSDWPYYPVALPLAKVLLGTQKHTSVREKILSSNAKRLLTQTRRYILKRRQ